MVFGLVRETDSGHGTVNNMTSESRQLIDAIRRYQNNPHYHPLTCGSVVEHKGDMKLQGVIRSDGVVDLWCKECGWMQGYIPEHILTIG